MKLLFENWRQFVKQEVEEFLPHGEVRAVEKIGSSVLPPEEQAKQDLEKYGYVRDEDDRDIDIEVEIAGITNEEAEEWAFSREAQELEDYYNYDVQLRIVENWNNFLNESGLKKSHTTLLYRLFSAYASNRNSKTTLTKLYKVKDRPPFSDIFKLQKISPGPYFRGMRLDKVPEPGETFEFNFGGWTTNESVAGKFAFNAGSDKVGVVFTTKDSKYAFIDINSFGEAIQEYIKKEYSQYDWDAQSTIGKPEMLSKLYTISDGLYKNEAEVVFEPFEARIKNIEKITSVGGKRLSTPVYKIEV